MKTTNSFEDGTQTQVQRPESKMFTIIAIILFIVGVIISLLQLLLNDDISLRTTDLPNHSEIVIGIMIGKLVLVAILLLAAQFMFKKKKGRISMILSIIFLIVASITTTSAFVARSKENRLNKVAMQKLISIASHFADNKDLDADKLEESRYGSIAPFLNLSNQYFISYKKLSTAMNADIKKLNVRTIVGASTFTTSAKINSSQQKIQVLMSELDKYASDTDKITNNMKSDVSKLDIPIRYKENIVTGFADGQLKAGDSLKNYVIFEKSFLKVIDTNMSFMLKEKANYMVKYNLIYFTKPADLATYNIYLTDLRKKAAEEVTMLNKIKSDNNKQLDNLEDLNR
ncbi:hypothetical protein LGK95_20555 [Clostridium algoriphilum]|uniref:hypothetical protein n=1 Tax=Clostridium algoriphilum TaxID=198347 RepID=UPI001CF284A0|nr:hypothetical protein [Clostridium algoriphilum]MCB2295857.1 hypothetical protein [Clostridium algoriphilum]